MTVPAIKLADGTDVAASDATCEGCGSSIADHNCAGGTGSGATVYVRRSGPTARVPVASAPTCAHCGGRLHQNGAAIEVNPACLARQYALDQGLMSNPFDRIPAHLATVEGLKEIVTWAESLSTPITYGKMASAAGGAGTYAGLKPKVGRKKKAVPAAAGSQIQDMADQEAEAAAGETPKKPKKSRKPKVATLSVAEDGSAEVESVDIEDAVAEATNGHDDDFEMVEEAEAPIAVAETEGSTPEDRAERRRLRKEKLKAGLVKR